MPGGPTTTWSMFAAAAVEVVSDRPPVPGEPAQRSRGGLLAASALPPALDVVRGRVRDHRRHRHSDPDAESPEERHVPGRNQGAHAGEEADLEQRAQRQHPPDPSEPCPPARAEALLGELSRLALDDFAGHDRRIGANRDEPKGRTADSATRRRAVGA
jgi:hypothetical protein